MLKKKSDRPTYILVVLQNKEMVYRGKDGERLPSFQQDLLNNFPSATFLGSNTNPSTDTMKQGEGQCILVADYSAIWWASPMM